jgi:hydrogenase nickel incorporation protein HypA/HybF
MHELGVTMELVDIAVLRAAGRRVTRLSVEIGDLAAIDRRSMLFCFEVCTKDTSLEGAELVFNSIPGRARCRSCRAEIEISKPYGRCACGSTSLEIVGGETLRLVEMEVL